MSDYERLSEYVILVDGKHYRLMTDRQVADFVWGNDKELSENTLKMRLEREEYLREHAESEYGKVYATNEALRAKLEKAEADNATLEADLWAANESLGHLNDHRVEVEKDNAKLRELLKKIEWRGDGHKECPLCCGFRPLHDPDCPLAAALKEGKNDSS